MAEQPNYRTHTVGYDGTYLTPVEPIQQIGERGPISDACLWSTLTLLHKMTNPKDFLLRFCDEYKSYGWTDAKGMIQTSYTFYVFSGPIGSREEVGYAGAIDSYAQVFRDFLLENKLGNVRRSREANNKNYGKRPARIYIWQPDDVALTAWYRANQK